MKNIYVYILIIGVILVIAGLWLSHRVEGFQSGTSTLLLSGIDKDGNIYIADSGLTNSPNWSKINGTMTQVSGSLGQFVGVNSLNKIFYGTQKPSMPFTWAQIGSSTDSNTHVSFDYPKVAAVIGNSVGYISDVTASTPLFTMLTPPVPFKWIDISVGSAYAIGTDNKIYYCPNITASQWSWTNVTGSMSGTPISQVSYDTNSVVVLTTGNKLWSATNVANPTWTELKGKDVKQMTLKSKNIFAIGTDNNIWYSPSHTNATWSQVSGNMVYVDSFYPITSTVFSERSAGNATCETGYKISGNKCVSECPLEYVEGETQCFKNPTSRTVNPPNTIPDLTYTCGATYQANFKPGAKCVSVVDATESSRAPLSEVFSVKGELTKLEAQAKCESYGANLANYEQVESAQAAGAGWCSWGWIADDQINTSKISFPVQATDSCYSDAPGTKVRLQNGSGKYGANCYGVKPPPTVKDTTKPTDTVSITVLPFKKVGSTETWNQAPPCDAGYTLKLNSTCLSICPEGTYGTSTYCSYAPTDKTSSAKVNLNFTCPTGYDAPDVTACSKVAANNTCEAGTPTCYEACPVGYIRNGTTCTKIDLKPTTAGTAAPKITYSCPAGYTLNSSNTCDQNCPSGYSTISNVCSSGNPVTSAQTIQCTDPAFPRFVPSRGTPRCTTASEPYVIGYSSPPVFQCPQGAKPYVSNNPNSACYTCPVISGTSGRLEQPDGLPATSTTCSDIPLRIMAQGSTKTTTCPDGYDLDTEGKICYEKCPAGLTLSVTVEPSGEYAVDAATGGVMDGVAQYGPGGTMIPSKKKFTCTPSSVVPYNVAPLTKPSNSLLGCIEYPGYQQSADKKTCSKCPEGYNRFGDYCLLSPLYTPPPLPPLPPRQTKPATFIPPCPTGHKLIGTTCYANCKAGDNDLGKQCQTPAGPRTTNTPTVSTPSTTLCNANSDFINNMCVTKCPTGKISTDTSCSDSAITRTVKSVKYTSPCNRNEELINDMCVTKCPSGVRNGSTCVPGKERVAPPSSIKCKSSDYGKYKRWLCQSQDDVDSLCTDPSATTMYADDNDQVCSTDSPTTMMYFCQTVAEAKEGTDVSDDIESIYGNTCSQLIKNYTDLNETVSNLQLLQSGVNDGTTGLQAANMTLRKVYSNQGCIENNTTPLCKGMQKYMDNIDGNVSDISSMKSQLSGYVQQAVAEKQKLLAFIRDFQCQL